MSSKNFKKEVYVNCRFVILFIESSVDVIVINMNTSLSLTHKIWCLC